NIRCTDMPWNSCGLLAASCWPEITGNGFCPTAATALRASCGLLATGCWPEFPGDGLCLSAATALLVGSKTFSTANCAATPLRAGTTALFVDCADSAATALLISCGLLASGCWLEMPVDGLCRSAATPLPSQPGAAVPHG